MKELLQRKSARVAPYPYLILWTSKLVFEYLGFLFSFFPLLFSSSFSRRECYPSLTPSHRRPGFEFKQSASLVLCKSPFP